MGSAVSPRSALPLLLATALLAGLSPAWAQQGDKVPVHVILNGQDMGDLVVTVTAEHTVWLPWGELRKLGLVNWPEALRRPDDVAVSLASLAPHLKHELDLTELGLNLTAEPELFENHILDLGYAPPKDIRYAQNDSAYLNYSLGVSGVEGSPSNAVSVPLEAAVRLGSTLAYSSFSYQHTESQDLAVRMLTNLNWDNPASRRRLTVGDFSAATDPLGGAGNFGGVSLATNYSVTPYFVRYPQLTVTGVAATPSDVRVFLNDQLVRTEKFTPGVFQVSNLPLAIGAGEVKLVITDAYGREQTVPLPFYLSTDLLKPGLHEYSYNLGYARQALGMQSDNYGDAALLATHRYGFADWLTAGLSAEGDSHVARLGVSGTVLLWRLGEFSLTAANSSAEAAQGTAATAQGSAGTAQASAGTAQGSAGTAEGSAYLADYRYQTRHFGVDVFTQSQTRDYSTLSMRPLDDKVKLLNGASIGMNSEFLGSLSLSYRAVQPYLAEATDTATLYYSRPLLRRELSLNLRATQVVTHTPTGPTTSNEVFAGIVWILGSSQSLSASRDTVNGQNSDALTLQKNIPLGPGVGYRVELDRRDGVAQDYGYGTNSTVQLNGYHGTYMANFVRLNGSDSGTVTAAGSVAYIDHGVYLTRPIQDSFALVRMSGVEGVRAYASNQEAGTTNSQGETVIPSLLAYFGNDISIDERDVPVNYSIPLLREHIAPPYRTGVVVDFSVTKLQAVVGTLFIVSAGNRIAAELAAISLEVAGKTVEAVVGKGGEFYLENIPAGTQQMHVLWKDQTCDVTLTVPKSEELFVNVGKVTCEAH